MRIRPTITTAHHPSTPSRWRLSPASYLATGSMFIATILVGIYATPLFIAADRAGAALFA